MVNERRSTALPGGSPFVGGPPLFPLVLFLALLCLTLSGPRAWAAYGLRRTNTYDLYLEPHLGAPSPDRRIEVAGRSYSAQEAASVRILPAFEGGKDVLEWRSEKGWVEWTVQIPEEGFYSIGLRYYPLPGRSRAIELSLSLDGAVPFDGAERIALPRVWKDAGPIGRDNRGNDTMPPQVEAPRWVEEQLSDTEGNHSGAFRFYFGRGTHRIRFAAIREPFVIDRLVISSDPPAPAYATVRARYADPPAPDALVVIRAETPDEKSDPVLHAVADRSSPATEPYHPSDIRLNAIGGANWRYPGQQIRWRVEVPADGLYKIALRYRQDAVRGFFTSRRVTIDGSLPFAELDAVRFPYDARWQVKTLGDAEPFLFPLSRGTHEIALEATLGDMAETLRTVEDAVYSLNYLYRRILMITGVNPDPFRDYSLEKEVPDLLPGFIAIAKTLREEARRLEEVTGHAGTEAALLLEIAVQLSSMTEKPETIAERLTNYRDNVSALGAWLLRIREQPLTLDSIYLASPDRKLPPPNATFARRLLHETRAFFASFFKDYTSIGNVYDRQRSVKVWVSLGRDQAQILKSMIDDQFTPATGITVNLSLVQGALVQATMAGKGPDVALNVGRGEPVNLAVRGALAPLDTLPGFASLEGRFMPSALVPYSFGGHVYALPETQSFHMLFYRKDIFQELGIEPPETWRDLYRIMPVIQRANMEVGLPYTVTDAWSLIGVGMGAQSLFPTLLYQHGGKIYRDDERATALDEPAGIAAFKEWTEFYTHYSFPLIYDFYNRFRTGQMPVGIQHYTFYNLFSVAAPELRNLWEMVPVPGTPRLDGTLDRSEGASGSGCMILSGAVNPTEAWEFLKWWTGEEAQTRYGREQEAIMGPAARYNPANVAAFLNMPWAERELRNIQAQWREVREVPEVPGGYYTSRNIDNAFRTVVFTWANHREVLFTWNKETNKEIARKRVEFGLDKE